MNLRWPSQRHWDEAREQLLLHRIDYIELASQNAEPEELDQAMYPPDFVTESVWLSFWWACRRAWLQDPLPLGLGLITLAVGIAGSIRLLLSSS